MILQIDLLAGRFTSAEGYLSAEDDDKLKIEHIYRDVPISIAQIPDINEYNEKLNGERNIPVPVPMSKIFWGFGPMGAI